MTTAVALRRLVAVSGRPWKADRSTGGPATSRIVLRGHRCGRLVPYGSTSWAPHIAIGITGAPVLSASRATPVLAFIGHWSGSREAVPSA